MKKLLSIILVTVMIFAMCPVTFAEDTTDTFEGYEYLFTAEALGGDNIGREDLIGKGLDLFPEGESAPWRYAGDLDIVNAYAAGGLDVLTDPVRAEQKSGCVAIELDVGQGGTYVPSLGYALRESAPIVDVYLVKADVLSNNISTETFGIGAGTVLNYINGLDDEYKLGEVDMYSSTDGETTAPFAAKELTAGKYYLLIRTSGTNNGFKALSDTYLYITLKSFSLSPFVEELPSVAKNHTYLLTDEALGGSDIPRGNLINMPIASFPEGESAPWRYAGDLDIDNAYAFNGLNVLAHPVRASDKSGCIAIELDVGQGGTYVPSLGYVLRESAPIVDVYLVKADVLSNNISTGTFGIGAAAVLNYINGLGDEYKLGKVDMYSSTDGEKESTFAERELTAGRHYLLIRTSGTNTAFKALSDAYLYITLKSFSLSPVEEETVEESVNNAFDYEEEKYIAGENATVTALAAYGNGEAVEDNDVISVDSITYGETCTVSVNSETVVKDDKTYNFLYWARGAATGKNRQILSSEPSFEYMPSEGNNILIAVYEEAGAEKAATFYNYNGQLLTDLELEDNKLPLLPSMAGFENPATKWVQLGTNNEFDAGEDVSELSGDKVFMAKYEAPINDIEIVVNGASDTYSYGDIVTCTPSVPEGQVFMYWTKTVAGAEGAEIVSLNPNYSFGAWESCTVTAVYGNEVPTLAKTMRKIIISAFSAGEETAIMAEFIGFEDALEKGIMFGEQKIAMMTGKSQFTVINDIGNVEITGYAIVSGDDGLKKITDGTVK